MNYLLWIAFLSLLFWGIYQKWDEKRMDYIENPIRTFIYFIFESFAIVFLYPKLVSYFIPSIFSFIFFIAILGFTLLVYKFIKKIFKIKFKITKLLKS
jgi:hypothetical protein